MRRLIEVFAAYALRLFSCEHHGVCLLHPHTKIGTGIVLFTIIFQISFLFVRMIIVWKGHLGYNASGHSDQSSLISFRISIRCTAVATRTDQTARMHKAVRYFYFVMHLWYMDPGGKQNDQWKNI